MGQEGTGVENGRVEAHAARRPNAMVRFLRSIWFGMTMLVLILVYASVGSALAPVRGALEMSEMDVFDHWLFVALIVLFSVSLVVSTVTRIKMRLVNGGSLMTHTGLLLLVVGCIWYFSSKVEGDVLLMSPRVEVLTAGGRGVPGANFLADEGETWEQFLPAAGGFVRCEVVETKVRGDEPVGQATVRVRMGEAEPVLVTLTANAVEATPLPGRLAVRLRSYAAQSKFYERDVPALYYGLKGSGMADFVAIKGLPLHRERYLGSEEPLRDAAGRPVPSKRTSPHLALAGLRIPTGWFEPWRLPIRLDVPGLPFDVEVTGYVPYIAGTESVPAGDGSEGEQAVVRPVIQPVEVRRPHMGRGPSAIRLKLVGRGELAGWSESRWCTFSHYPRLEAPEEMEAYGPRPVTVGLPDGSEYELMYSRAERDLGAELVPGKLSVKFFPGRRRAESWCSDFYVNADGEAALRPAYVATNETYKVGEWTLFQSGAEAGGHWRWTILGVGNRHGMGTMTVGSALITIGCLYAFYVKPILRRRGGGGTGRRESKRGGHATRSAEEAAVTAEVER